MNSTLKKIIKRIIPNFFIQKYKEFKQRKKSNEAQQHYSTVITELNNSSNEKRLILIGSAVSGNLGDQAISIAEMKFLKSNFSERKIIEIPHILYTQATNVIKPLINNKDILLINGGGFLGTLWPLAENMARDIISSFRHNKIIIFPQTIFFENSTKGKEELAKSVEIFQSHPDLTIFVRDSKSYAFAQQNYIGGNLTNIYLVPDIVTSLNHDNGESNRKNIVFCMRRDKEKVEHTELRASIEQYVEKISDSKFIFYTDTVIEEELDLFNRSQSVDKLLEEFSEARLVITDRLHGLILSAITGTPCLAMNNVSGKVKGAYEWVSYLEYIEYADSSKDISEQINYLLNLETTHYDNERLVEKHNLIKDTIKNDL